MTEAIIILFEEHSIIAPLLFILLRITSIVIPPIPGIVVDFIGIIAFGKFFGFLYGEIGVMLGAVITFFIARKFREKAVKRFTSLQRLNEWEEKLSEQKKFWGLVLLRLPTSAFF